MADVYFGNGGSDSTGDGSEGNPYLNFDTAVSNSSGGDTLKGVDGEIRHQSSAYVFDVARSVESANYRGCILKTAVSSSAGYVLRTSGNLTAGNNPHVIRNMAMDAEDDQNVCLRIIRDASEDLELDFYGLDLRNASLYPINNEMRRGTQRFFNTKLTGSPTTSLLRTGGSAMASDGDQTIIVDGFDANVSTDSSHTSINLDKVDNLTNTATAKISGVTGVYTSSDFNSVIYCNGVDNVDIENCNFTVNSDVNAYGAFVEGKATAATASSKIKNLNIRFNSPAGYAISHGRSDNGSSSNVTAGGIYGCTVRGKYYSANTPHGPTLGEGTDGEILGCHTSEIYAGYLISKTTDADVSGNVAFNCYGPNFYIKGATDCTVARNAVVQTGKLIQRTNGLLAVNHQGGVDTVAALITENIIIVLDISKIHSLAQIVDSSQVCSFVSNVYYIPESVDVDTEQLFSYQSSTPTDTISQWLARTEVTGDEVIQLPLSELSKMANKYKLSTASSGGIVGSIVG